MEKIKFGFCVPVFANPGMVFFRTPAYEKLDWESIKNTVSFCDSMGYDSIFIADHLFLGRDGDIWECVALMSAFAAITQNVEIIPIHLCNNFRTPSVVAKTLSTISHISGGRVALFYDYGWRKAEFDAYGIDFCNNDDERIKQMTEGLAIIKGMLEEKRFSFKGKYYTVENAICNPKPVRKIPVWMGEANHKEMIKNIVKYADVFNSMPCSVSAFSKKLEAIKKECDSQGRDFSSLGLSLETQILIRETESEIDSLFNEFEKLKSLNNSYDNDIIEQLKATNSNLENYSSREILNDEFIIGTPETVKKKLETYIEKGVSHFMLWFMDYPVKTGMELFADKVMSDFRG